MRPQTNPFPLLVALSFVLLTACSQRADGDEEIRKMIVGTWKAQTKGATIPGGAKEYKIIEFTHDNRYREVEYDGYWSDWNSADSINCGVCYHNITFEDSVYYEIKDSEIHYSTTKSELPYPNFLPTDDAVVWLKPTVVKINFTKYEKI